jgi:hypothetical protein
MLTIREGQFSALKNEVRRRLNARVCVALHGALLEYTGKYSLFDLAAFVDASINLAEHWGFTSETSVLDFAGLRLQFATVFDLDPTIQRFLNDTRQSDQEHRLSALQQLLSETHFLGAGVDQH